MREAAIRAALGSARARLVRQYLAESLLVSVIGGMCGVALALAATRLFIAWNPLGTLPANVIQLDLRVLSIAAAATLVTTIVCGLVPALRVSSANPQDALVAGGERGAVTRPSERAQTALLVGQMAMSIVVLVAATLLTRTFIRLDNEPLGFDSSNLWVASVTLPKDPFDTADERNTFYRQLDERLRAVPGVEAVAAGTSPPLNSGPPVTVNTGPDDSPDAPRISAQDVTTGFFAGLDVPLVAGRLVDHPLERRGQRDGERRATACRWCPGCHRHLLRAGPGAGVRGDVRPRKLRARRLRRRCQQQPLLGYVQYVQW
jgi:hypothetical protein